MTRGQQHAPANRHRNASQWAYRRHRVDINENPPEDAQTIEFAVMALPDPYCGIVKHHARIGRPPEWRPDPDAKLVHLVAVRHARERYCQWHQALVVLRHSINGALFRFSVSGPSAADEPWRKGSPAASDRQQRAF